MLYIVTSDQSGGKAVGIMNTTSETTFHASRILIRLSEIPASVQLTNNLAIHPGTILIRETYPRFGSTVTTAYMEGGTLVLQGKPEGNHVDNSTTIAKNTGDATAIGHGSTAITGIVRGGKAATPPQSANASYVYYDGLSPQTIKRTGGKRKVEIVVGRGCEYAIA